MNYIPRTKDFWAGALFVALALLAFHFGSSLALGTARQMGPRYFPALIASGLLLIGGATMVRGLMRDAEVIEPARMRSFIILLAVLLFALLLRPAGLVAAVVVMVTVAGLARRPTVHPLHSFAIAALLSVFAWAVFIRGLALPLKTWPF